MRQRKEEANVNKDKYEDTREKTQRRDKRDEEKSTPYTGVKEGKKIKQEKEKNERE